MTRPCSPTRPAFLALLFCTTLALHAQTASTYGFQAQQGVPLLELTGPNELLGPGLDDDVSALTSIGFTFTYEGQDHLGFSVSVNGVLHLGDAPMAPVYGSNITGPNNTPRLMPLWADHTTNGGGSVITQLLGTTPDRVRVVQWQVGIPYGSPANSTFQLLLHEGGAVEFRYGAGQAPANDAGIAIGGAVPTDMISITPPASMNNATPNNAVGAWPGEGRSYTFTPPAVACGTPQPGATTATATSLCAGMYTTLGTELQGSASGLAFQWQHAADGTTWEPITDSIATTLTIPVEATAWYRCAVTCLTSGETAYSTPLEIALNEPSVTYLAFDPATGHAEDFDAWADRCSTKDVPGASWRTTPAYGENSWRRHDEGIATGGWGNSGWNVNMDPVEGKAARFHSRGSAGLTGTLDLYLDMSATNGPATLAFRYINSAGGGTLTVQLSTDGGASFTTVGAPLGLTSPPFNAWTDQTFSFTSTSPTTVVRLLATGPDTNTGNDIGVDGLTVTAGTTTGTNDATAPAMRIHPVPASDVLVVDLAKEGTGMPRSYRMFDATGRVRLEGSMTDVRMQLDVRGLAPGRYLLEIAGVGAGRTRMPVIIAR